MPETKRPIYVGAGHDNRDPGAVSPDGKHKEADLAARLRNLVVTSLRGRGVNPTTDGSGTRNLPLTEALAILSKLNNPVAIECHMNAASNPNARGVEVLAHEQDKDLAQALAGAVSKVAGIPLRGAYGWRPESSGQHTRLAFVRAGGLILETCFIGNRLDMEAYIKHEWDIAEAIADVLVRFAGGSAPVEA